MIVREDQDKQTGAGDSLLNDLERTIAEKVETGHADEARYGFAAQVANATPPVNRAFQRALRARILAELTESEGRTITAKERKRTGGSWRSSLLAALAAALVLLMAIAVSLLTDAWEPGMEARVPTAAPSPLASRDVDALVDRFKEDSAPRTVLVFPSHYAEGLVGRIQHKVVPLKLSRDLAPAAIQAALGAALPSSGLVDMIMVNQEATDAERSVRIALEQQLYRLYRLGETGTETFGALERNQYVVGSEDVTLESIGAVFENGVELVAVGILDNPQPGEPLRLAFDWRVTAPVDDSVVVFAHLICDGGRLVAQRDAVPGNGLFPVEGWGPGELVRDQFALLLPSDLPTGKCEIQVGAYNATSGQRYSLIEPEGGTYVVVQQFTIEE